MPSNLYRCPLCTQNHPLPAPSAPTLDQAELLLRRLKREMALDFHLHSSLRDPELSLNILYGPARGQMFGILAARCILGKVHYLKAFSGKFNGRWHAEGWAPPLFDISKYSLIEHPQELQIKKLTQQISRLQDSCEAASPRESAGELTRLKRERKHTSQSLMRQLHALYRLPDLSGRLHRLEDIFSGNRRPPTGTGDCCAPKLLGEAARRGLQPLELAEFYLGAENPSKTRREGQFYPPCDEKCSPILGAMLCPGEIK